MTDKDKHIVEAVQWGALRGGNRFYYYLVPTSTRRDGKMKVSIKAIEALVKKGLVTRDQLPALK